MLSDSTRWRKHEHEDERRRRYKNTQLAFLEMKAGVLEIKKKIMGGINGWLDTAEENLSKLELTVMERILSEAEEELKLIISLSCGTLSTGQTYIESVSGKGEKREQRNILRNR